MTEFTFRTIGVVHSCFKEKFGIPRQSGLAQNAEGSIELLDEFANEQALLGIEQFSHLWVCFVFHQNAEHSWRPRVRPPRLGGNESIGVFATRSGVRPNPIGWSAVRFHDRRIESGRLFLDISGLDMVDGTPVLDIKPYIPYADAITSAQAGFAHQKPSQPFQVNFSSEALTSIAQYARQYPNLKSLIVETLSLDPRPAYYATQPRKSQFGMRIYNFDIKWSVDDNSVLVTFIDCVTQV